VISKGGGIVEGDIVKGSKSEVTFFSVYYLKEEKKSAPL